MSSFRIHAVADRIVLVHDMADCIVHSELDVEQADVLLQQLEQAKGTALLHLREQDFLGFLADIGLPADSPHT